MSGAYPTEVSYPATYQGRLAPAHMAAACALNGVAAPPIDRRYAWCELGSGTGFTANLLAAANPFAEFHAIDFNPRHAEAGAALALVGALPNVRHHALDFAAAMTADLPDFDFVVLHGVWTWVDDGARRAIVAFLANRLRPGGLVQVSYSARPGLDAVAALRAMLGEAGLADDLDAAKAFAGRLAAAAPEMLRRSPALADYLRAFARMPDASARHDFLAPDWSALHHREVRRAMAAAGLVFAGDADLPMNRPDLALEADAAAIVDGLDGAAAEAAKDLVTQRTLRRDIYRRPARADGRSPFAELRVTLAVPPDAAVAAALPAGRHGAMPALLLAVTERLDHAAPVACDLVAALAADGFDRAHVQEQLATLLAAGTIIPAVSAPRTGLLAEWPRLAPFNRAALDHAVEPDDARVLASPVTGGGIVLDRSTGYLVWAVATAEPAGAARMLAARLAAEGRTLTIAGRTIADAAGLAGVLSPQLDRFAAEQLPRLVALGVVA
ncbi:MAG: methyltransferase regulatory domain-containing protein [Alphaproteobacteria bacterium]